MRILIAILIGISVVLMVGSSFASESLSDAGLHLFKRINEARVSPLAVAAELGIDPDTVVNRLPALKEILENGLPPLKWNGQLYIAAAGHTSDMMDQNYYSRIAANGNTPTDRVMQAGYTPVVVGESLGMLGFVNYLSPTVAAEAIFRNMFMDELRTDGSEPRTILSNKYKEIGIGVGAGDFVLQGAAQNVYIATCDYSRSAASNLELALLELINQVRHEPRAFAESIGISADSFPERLPEDLLSYQVQFPPVTLIPGLMFATEQHGMDMLETGTFKIVFEDEGKTPASRAEENGVLSTHMHAAFRIHSTTDYVNPETAARNNLQVIFRHELNMPPEERVLLNPDVDTMGISYISATPNGNIKEVAYLLPYYNQLLVIYSAQVKNKTMAHFLTGSVYEDINLNGLYDIGEGLGNRVVRIDSLGSGQTGLAAVSNVEGGFGLALESGGYRATVTSEAGQMEQVFSLDQDNVATIFPLDFQAGE